MRVSNGAAGNSFAVWRLATWKNIQTLLYGQMEFG